MINSLQLHPYYRDSWGFWDSHVNPALAPLDHNSCYQPKYYNAPEVGLQLMNPGSYQEYTLTITPGALIWGIFHFDNLLPTFTVNLAVPLFNVQIKDVSTGHKFFDTPLSNYFLSNPNSTEPNLFPTPYPVSGTGLFSVELWANPANNGQQRCGFVFGVAEVITCPQ